MHHGLIFQVYTNESMGGHDVWSDKHHRRQAGGHRIATFLRSHAWDIEVVDFAAQFTLGELQEICRRRINNDTVFCSFSCIFGSWPTVMEQLAAWIKTTWPTIVNICGGTMWPYVTSKSIDYYITGYGEQAIYKLLKVLTGNELKNSLVFDLRFADRKVISANQSYPAFPMPILSIDYQARDFLLPDEWLHVELSRGCIFKCKFCNYPVLNVKGDYTQEADDFYRNMQSNFDKFGTKNYYVVDETFNDRPDKISKFADAVQRLSFVPFYSGFIRADLLVSRPQDREDLLKMNFLGHHYGIESLNYKSSTAIGKGMHPDVLTAGLLDVKDFFQSNSRKIYRGSMSFIAGLPYETKQTMLSTVDWLRNNWQDQHTIWFPLFIPDKENNIHGWDDSMSDMGVDYAKFGYERDDAELAYAGAGGMPWKNQDLSLSASAKFTTTIVPLILKGAASSTSSLTLDECTNPSRSIDQALSEPESSYYTSQSSMYRKHIVQHYKNNKINM